MDIHKFHSCNNFMILKFWNLNDATVPFCCKLNFMESIQTSYLICLFMKNTKKFIPVITWVYVMPNKTQFPSRWECLFKYYFLLKYNLKLFLKYSLKLIKNSCFFVTLKIHLVFSRVKYLNFEMFWYLIDCFSFRTPVISIPIW